MRSITKGIWSLAALAAMTASAWAGDAVRLSVEPPRGVETVEAGDPGIDVNIVGIDANGTRVGPGDKKVEVSATEGDLTLVEAPYRYRYMPPAAVGADVPVKLSAWFKQDPNVRGEATLTIVPRHPYERLVLVAPATTLELGKSMEIEVRGVRADGTSTLVKDQNIVMTSDGVGTVESLTQGMYRYNAPPRSETRSVGATGHMRAALRKWPKVSGELSIVVTGEKPPPGSGQPPSQNPPPTQPPQNPPPTNPPPTNPPPTQPPAQGDEGGVTLPSGNAKILVWRTKALKTDEWSKKREDIPTGGKPLVARDAFHLLRVEIERADVVKVELEWYVGDKKGAPVRVDDADKDGRLRLEKNKAGKTVALIEAETPESAKPVYLNLLLTTRKGEVLKEEIVVQRGADRNDDGRKDGPKKK